MSATWGAYKGGIPMKKSELQAMKLFQLKRLAQKHDVPGRTKMNKEQLVEALAARKIELAPRVIRAHAKPQPRPRGTAAVRPVSATRPAPAPAAQRPAPAAFPQRPESRTPPAPPFPKAAAARPAQPAEAYEPQELPWQYQVDRIILMPRDPYWMFAYWEITRERYEAALHRLAVPPESAKAILRVHDVTGLLDTATGEVRLAEPHSFLRIELAPMADRWYIRVDQPEHAYCVEVLLEAPDGRVASLALSNVVATPNDRVSGVTEEEWGTGLPRRRRVSRGHGPAESKWLVPEQRFLVTSPGLRPGAGRWASGGLAGSGSGRGVRS